jgi:replicative DNA helicase
MNPAHVERARDSVLGSLLHFYTPKSVVIVQAQGVTPKDFGTPENRSHVLYRAILALHKAGDMVDQLTAEGFLARHGLLDRAGGLPYMELLAVSARPSALKEHAALVAEDALWHRRMAAKETFVKAVETRNEALLQSALARMVPSVEPSLRVIQGGRERTA